MVFRILKRRPRIGVAAFAKGTATSTSATSSSTLPLDDGTTSDLTESQGPCPAWESLLQQGKWDAFVQVVAACLSSSSSMTSTTSTTTNQ